MNEWLNSEKGKKQYQELKQFVCSSDSGGMDNFRKERSHVMSLAYACLEDTDLTFSQCQKEAWKVRKNLRCK